MSRLNTVRRRASHLVTEFVGQCVVDQRPIEAEGGVQDPIGLRGHIQQGYVLVLTVKIPGFEGVLVFGLSGGGGAPYANASPPRVIGWAREPGTPVVVDIDDGRCRPGKRVRMDRTTLGMDDDHRYIGVESQHVR